MTLSGLTAGDYDLRVRAQGFHEHRRSVALSPDRASQIAIDLDELRDWQAGAFGSVLFFPGDTSSESSTPVIFDGGALYGRELWGPFQAGGLIGYSGYTPVDGKTLHGGMLGAHISIGGCLCMETMAKLSANYAADPNAAAQAQHWLDDDTTSTNFALVHGRLRSKLVYRTPGFVTAEVGFELGMMGIMSFEFFWSPVLVGRDELSGAHAVGARLVLGYSAFYRGPR